MYRSGSLGKLMTVYLNIHQRVQFHFQWLSILPSLHEALRLMTTRVISAEEEASSTLTANGDFGGCT
jgi:hypothetical protein